MSNLVGRVHFTSSIDGKNMPRDAEKAGRAAGKAAGEGYDKEWQKTFRDTLTKAGQRSYDAWNRAGRRDGGTYGRELQRRLDSFLAIARRNFQNLHFDPGFLDDFAKGFDDAGVAAGELQRQLKTLRDENEIHHASYERARRVVSEWAEAQREAAIEANRLADAQERSDRNLRNRTERLLEQALAIDRANEKQRVYDESLRKEENRIRGVNLSLDEMVRRMEASRDATDRAGRSAEGFSFRWRDLSHNTRQWTLIIGAVLAAMEDLAVLGSAAGAGLIAVGSAATSGIIGVGGLAAVISVLAKDLDKLPPEFRAVAAEAQDFGRVFVSLRDDIARGAFSELDGVFERLGNTLRTLSPEMRGLGITIGGLFRDLERNVRPGADAFAELRRTAQLAAPNFNQLARSAGTFGTAFLRAFNRAQPLTQDLLFWINRLAERFDQFTRSRGFDDWMRNAEIIFGRLGPLIDAVGRSLNDLVTPDSVRRTELFLQNLTDFMPHLTGFLDMLGRLNIFGIIAAALADLGRAMEPLGPAFADLADAANTFATVLIDELADVLTGVMQVIAPFAQAAADLLNALPEDVIRGIANGVATLGGAFLIFKGLSLAGLTGEITSLRKGLDVLTATGGKAGRVLGGLSAVLGRAGLVGAFIGVSVAMPQIIRGFTDWLDEVSGINDALATSVRRNEDFGKSLARVNQNFQPTNDQIRQLLDLLNEAGGEWQEINRGTAEFGQSATQTEAAAGQLVRGIQQLDEQLQGMSVDEQIARFLQWRDSLELTDAQAIQLIEQTETLRGTLEHLAGANGEAVTGQDLLNEALENGGGSAGRMERALSDMSGQVVNARDEIEKLSDHIRNFGDLELSTEEATIRFEQSVADLEESLRENGATLARNTEEGRENRLAILDSIQAAKDHAAAVHDQTGDVGAANAVLADHRKRLEDTLRQLGFNEEEIAEYTRLLNLIPKNLQTNIDLNARDALTQAELLRRAILNIPQNRTVTVSVAGGWNASVGNRPMAEGGVLDRPTHVLAGEAGREAFVPLDRPLSQVDPSVRWLAAVAQGKSPIPHMANGGIAGPSGPQIVVSEGAIVVNESGDPRRSANEVLTRLVEDVVG